jgi:hypothetical protein
MKELSIRERLELFWAGERPDRIPYTIYQNEWRHTAKDPAWEAMYRAGLGVAWHLPSVREVHPEVEFLSETSQVDGKKFERRILRTPVGEIDETFLDEWQQKFFLESAEDYAVMTWIVKHTTVEPAYEEFLRRSDEIGPFGIPMVMLGRTPNQSILVDLVGLENYAYHLADLSSAMQELYDALLAKFKRKVELAAEGPGRFVAVLENFTADTLGPARYRKVLMPVYEECFPILQAGGKVVGVHYDGQLSAVKKLIAQAPMNLIESLTPPPEGDMTLAECREAWPDKLFWSNINVECYYLPPTELKQVVLDRVAQAAPDGRLLAFEVSEQYPDNWQQSIPVVLDALMETRQG